MAQPAAVSIGAEVSDFRLVVTGLAPFGRPGPASEAPMARIGRLVPNGPMAAAGFNTGDLVLTVRAGPVVGATSGDENILGVRYVPFWSSRISSAADLQTVLSQKRPGEEILVGWSRREFYPRAFLRRVVLGSPQPSSALEERPAPAAPDFVALARDTFYLRAAGTLDNRIQSRILQTTQSQWTGRTNVDSRSTSCSASAKTGELPRLVFNESYVSPKAFEIEFAPKVKVVYVRTGMQTLPSAVSNFFEATRELRAGYEKILGSLHQAERDAIRALDQTGAISVELANEFAWWTSRAQQMRLVFIALTRNPTALGQVNRWLGLSLPADDELDALPPWDPRLLHISLRRAFFQHSQCSGAKDQTTAGKLRFMKISTGQGRDQSLYDYILAATGSQARFDRIVADLERTQYLAMGGVELSMPLDWLGYTNAYLGTNLRPDDAFGSVEESLKAYLARTSITSAFSAYQRQKGWAPNPGATQAECERRHLSRVAEYMFWSMPLVGGAREGHNPFQMGASPTFGEALRLSCTDPERPLDLVHPQFTIELAKAGSGGVLQDMSRQESINWDRWVGLPQSRNAP